MRTARRSLTPRVLKELLPVHFTLRIPPFLFSSIFPSSWLPRFQWVRTINSRRCTPSIARKANPIRSTRSHHPHSHPRRKRGHGGRWIFGSCPSWLSSISSLSLTEVRRDCSQQFGSYLTQSHRKHRLAWHIPGCSAVGMLTPSRSRKVARSVRATQIDRRQVQHRAREFRFLCFVLVLILIRPADHVFHCASLTIDHSIYH